jgi:hypothetical protein
MYMYITSPEAAFAGMINHIEFLRLLSLGGRCAPFGPQCCLSPVLALFMWLYLLFEAVFAWSGDIFAL